ncbi:hypothetical protein BDZ94DRAFT_1164780 [Collybia nuda]|uniref:Uncharacterized protein n=1 Tax=Collybia nuda TaxID=64659 RepID=A0A9P5Y793_9AGAR|nr:hypothetical protein BDZ94DRAFT_1164780 [Collybia nuda]
MSRGDRAAASGNLSTSMRDNYREFGVSEYYKKVGSTYRNPHFPGVRLCLFTWLNKWWQMEYDGIKKHEKLSIFDMACGIGEVTLACLEWQRTGRNFYCSLTEQHGNAQSKYQGQSITVHQRESDTTPPALGSDFPQLHVTAADPFTSAAYYNRTALPCSPLSFKDISEGALPPLASSESPVGESSLYGSNDERGVLSRSNPPIEMVICSFALHLVESPSELFSLLWELSLKARWLVVLAPHKRPEIKEGWGWSKWNVDAWQGSRMQDNIGELLHDRPVVLNIQEALKLNDCFGLGYVVVCIKA